MSAVFQHGALRLYLLSLLAERPMHGYEVMQSLEQRFGGTYSPSAGTIYPRLAKLEEEGFVTKTVEGRKSTYTITQAGREHLAARSGELDALDSEVRDSVRRLAREVRGGVDAAMQSLRAELAAAADSGRARRRSARSGAQSGQAAEDGASATEQPGDAWQSGADRQAPRQADARAEHGQSLGELELELAAFSRELRSYARRLPEFDRQSVRRVKEQLDLALAAIRAR